MVGSKHKAVLTFSLFILPALLVYAIFFIFPFFQGILISLTNWDGLSAKNPIKIERKAFEDKILAKAGDPADKAFLQSIYTLNDDQTDYLRTELSLENRGRLEKFFSDIKYENEGYKFIGLKNYEDLFAGRVKDNFYPRTKVSHYFNDLSDLPGDFPEGQFSGLFLNRLTNPQDKALAQKFYQRSEDGKTFQLVSTFNEFDLKDGLRKFPAADATAVENLIADVEKSGFTGSGNGVDLVTAFEGFGNLPPDLQLQLKTAAQNVSQLGYFKKLLSQNLKEEKLEMGVVGFTLFFTLFNVLFTNLAAFLLAMGLDRAFRGRNFLRSVFFLPNILSLVIVAFIWSLVFNALLPRVTGIALWMGNPDLAPTLIVLVSVWQGCGYLMVIYLAGLQSIPTEIQEAAAVDGAGWFKRLVNITLPLLLPAFTICFFLSISNSLKAFDLIYALAGKNNYNFNLVPMVLDIYNDAFAFSKYGLANAKAIVLMVVILIFTGIQLAVMKKREVEY